ncbi:MAG TPA: stage II sporulation protein R [Virgibacillus sp.]|nr:stage II sporulation protein R [Virgibacillus sp.]
MKKLVFFIFIIIIFFSIVPNIGIGYQAEQNEEDIYEVIPDEAIRLRILAHSDDDKDQEVKRLVRDAVSDQISGWVEHMDDIDEARQVIQDRLPEITETAAKVLANVDDEKLLEVDYGENVTFPMKLYDTYLYPEGEYEAVLITIGDGQGANWWCVLFPPLCFLDFADGALVDDTDTDEDVTENRAAIEEEEEDSVEVKFFLFEWFGWT